MYVSLVSDKHVFCAVIKMLYKGHLCGQHIGEIYSLDGDT